MRLYRSPGAGLESLGVATGLGEALETLKPVLQPEGPVLAVGPLAGAVVASLLSPDMHVVEGDPAEWSAQDDTAGIIVVGNALAAVPESERYAWLESAARCLRSGGLLVLGDRGWMPSGLPPRLRHLLRLPPEPVDAAGTVILLRT